MTTQITVRLADDAVQAVDETVREGLFASRATYLTWLVQRDAMRRRSLADLQRMAAEGEPYPELHGLATSAAATPLDLD